MHTDATRRDRPAARRMNGTSSSSASAARVPAPPGTTSVSIGPRTDESLAPAAIAYPAGVSIGSLLWATTSMR